MSPEVLVNYKYNQ